MDYHNPALQFKKKNPAGNFIANYSVRNTTAGGQPESFDISMDVVAVSGENAEESFDLGSHAPFKSLELSNASVSTIISVKDSEASFSVQIRQKTDELVEQGYSDQQVRDYFVARYGEWILRSPPKEGFNLLLWSVPGIGIFFALTLLYFWARKNANSSQQNHQVVEETEQSLTEEELARLNKDLQKFEKSNRL